MSTQYTPGPWRVFNYSWSDTCVLADGFDHAICLLDINQATEDSQEADESLMAANARLIAAAPDLLAALIDCRRALEIANFTQELAVVDAAIAKADGDAVGGKSGGAK